VLATVLFTDIVGATERPPPWVTAAGVIFWMLTTRWCAGNSRASGARGGYDG
jgi:hypothetical protein